MSDGYAEGPEQDSPIPGKRQPFRKLFRRGGKTYVEPDASLIQTTVVEKGGWMRDFRKFIERNQIHYIVFFTLVLILTYVAASRYYPGYTEVITGIVATSIIVSAAASYSQAVADDRHHREWIHGAQFEFDEIDLGQEMDNLNLSRKVLQVRMTRVFLYEIRDYMRTEESALRIQLENDHVFDGLTKIHEVTSVDDTGRIFIGDKDGIPSGVVLQMGMPSADYVAERIKKARKDIEKNGNSYDDIQGFIRLHTAWGKVWDKMMKYQKEKHLHIIDVDGSPEWAKKYFLALEKSSLPYWSDRPEKGEVGMSFFHSMPPEARLPIMLRLKRDYDEIKHEKVQMAIQRQSDLLDNRVFAILEVLKMLGIMDEEIEKILAQKKISLTSVEDREIMLKIEEAKKAAGEQ